MSGTIVRHFPRLALSAFAAVIICGTLTADDWPQWGGPRRDIVWRETGIVRELPTEELLPRVWSTPIAEGYSGPAVAAGRVYITDRDLGERVERVLCLDADTGDVLWKYEYEVEYAIHFPAGPRTTPTVDNGYVYTIGAMGHLICFDAENGNVIWRQYFPEDFGTRVPTWGMVSSPLIDGDQLIALVGGTDGSLVVSFDKRTGREKWRALDDPEVGYCPPVIFKFVDSRQLIIWHPRALSALDPSSGELLWAFPWTIRSGLSIPMPRQAGDRLFLTAFYHGPRMLEVEPGGGGVRLVWRGNSDSEMETDGLHSIMPTPWVTESHIYGVCSHGQLRCLDAQSGERIWETLDATGSGRWWNAFLISHEDRFFIHNEQGDLIIAELTPAGYNEISRAKLVEPTRPVQRRMTIWSHPAFAMKSVFARNDREIVRVDLAAP